MTFLLANWKLLIVGLLVATIGAQTLRLKLVQDEFKEFRIAVEVAGRVQEAQTKQLIAEGKSRKDKADAENSAALATLAGTVKRLRDTNASRSVLPTASTASSRPDLACFDRAEYLRADGAATENLFSGARGLADEGTKNTVDLDSARMWAGQADR